LRKINRSKVIHFFVLFVLFVTTTTFAWAGMMDSDMKKDMMDSGMMDSDTSGHQGCPEMDSGMMDPKMMKDMMGSGMMKNMMGSGMMKKCQGMMETSGSTGDIRTIIGHRDELDLTDKQTTALESIQSSLEKELIRRRAELQAAEMDLADLLEEDKVELSSVESKLKRIRKLQTEMRLSRIKAQLQARDLLDEEQRKMWKSGK